MRKHSLLLVLIGCVAVIVGLCSAESALAQLRVPPAHVATLAVQSDDDIAFTEVENADTVSQQNSVPVLPVQHVVPQGQAQPTAQPLPQPVVTQHIATTPAVQQQPLATVQVAPQVQAQLQVAAPPQAMMQMQTAPMQAAPMPGMAGGAIVIPVTVPQYVTYTPQPVTMMVNRPAQLVIPQQYPYPAPMPQMYDPMLAMQMQQQQMMPMMMQPQMPMMQARPQQPIPVKMILPDGSTVSIKHYVPGNYLKNVWRAVTP